MHKQMLFDLECLSLGLPPLFKSTIQAAGMVFDLPPSDRRKMSRKIRKIAKAQVNLTCQRIKNKKKRSRIRTAMETRANLGNEKETFSKRVLINRLALVRKNVEERLTTAQ